MIGNLFWNGTEKRLRALWRIVLQGIIFVTGTLLGSLVSSVIALVVITASGDSMTDPQIIARLAAHPITRLGGAITALLAMFLSYWITARWIDRRPLRSFGFNFNRAWWLDMAFGLFLGAFLMLLIFLAELALGWVKVTGTFQSRLPEYGFWGSILGMVIVYLCVGVYEEMLSRGYQLRNMAEGLNHKRIGPRGALLLAYLLSSSIFGLLHLGNENATWVSTFNLVIAGLFLGLGYVLTGELAISIGLHITWNFFQGNVFGFPVSGGASAVSFIAIEQGGPRLWTGAEFGPEAGLIGLLAIALGCALIAAWVRWRRGKAQLKDSLAVYTPEPAFAAQVPSQTVIQS